MSCLQEASAEGVPQVRRNRLRREETPVSEEAMKTVRFGDVQIGGRFYWGGTVYVKLSNHNPTAAQPWYNAREAKGVPWHHSFLHDTMVGVITTMICPRCHGHGNDSNTVFMGGERVPCPRCKGTGRVCSDCRGTGVIGVPDDQGVMGSGQCTACKGTGRPH